MKHFYPSFSCCKTSLIIGVSLIFTSPVYADLLDVYTDEKGDTNWQYLANTASGLIIIILSMAAILLYLSQRRERKANRALEAIRNVLELKVKERTATLDESNKMLREANQNLQGETDQHRRTAQRLRESEAYIKNILESMPLMLIGLNRDSCITQWNQYAEKNTGITQDKALGKNLWEAYPSITVFPDQIEMVSRTRKPLTIKHSQRGQYYFDITIYPLQDQQETGLVVLVDDVTQRILAENMLIQRDKMSSMGELASIMAHDISIPLETIIQDVEAVQQQLTTGQQNSEQIERKLTEAVNAGKGANRVIANLLEFSRSSGDEKTPRQMSEIINQAINLANDVIAAPSGLHFKDIVIDRKFAKDLPALPCYAAELQQVFLSLFRHACHSLGEKVVEGDRPMLSIELAEHYDALWVKVHHNGQSLSGEEQQFIFEPFFSNHSEADDNYDMGKRLSFSYFIVTEHHDGQMAVTSDSRHGTTFHLQFQLSP